MTIKKRITELDRQIDNGAGRIFSAPSSLTSTLYKKLGELQAERERCQAQLEEAQRRHNGTDPQGAEEIDKAIAALHDLNGAFETADPTDTRELLMSLVSRLDRFFNRHKCRKYTRTSFREGLIYLRPEGISPNLSTTSQLHDSQRRLASYLAAWPI